MAKAPAIGQSVTASQGLFHRLRDFFEHDLRCRRLEMLTGKPKAVLVPSTLAVGIDAPMPRKRTQYLLKRALKRLHRRLPNVTRSRIGSCASGIHSGVYSPAIEGRAVKAP
jgi:hypothetical protein